MKNFWSNGRSGHAKMREAMALNASASRESNLEGRECVNCGGNRIGRSRRDRFFPPSLPAYCQLLLPTADCLQPSSPLPTSSLEIPCWILDIYPLPPSTPHLHPGLLALHPTHWQRPSNATRPTRQSGCYENRWQPSPEVFFASFFHRQSHSCLHSGTLVSLNCPVRLNLLMASLKLPKVRQSVPLCAMHYRNSTSSRIAHVSRPEFQSSILSCY